MHMCELTHFSCVWLWDPMDCSPPGSPVLGILQARILEWVAMFSSKGSSWPRDRTHISYVSCIGRQIFYWRLCRFFNAIPLKMSMAFFTGSRTDNFKMCMRTQKTWNNQNNIEKGEQCWRSQILPDFTLHYKATVIKTVEYWHKPYTYVNGTEYTVPKSTRINHSSKLSHCNFIRLLLIRKKFHLEQPRSH